MRILHPSQWNWPKEASEYLRAAKEIEDLRRENVARAIASRFDPVAFRMDTFEDQLAADNDRRKMVGDIMAQHALQQSLKQTADNRAAETPIVEIEHR